MTLCIPNVWQCYYIVVYTDDFAHCKMFWIIIQSKHCTYHSGIKSVKTLCHSKHAVHLFFVYFPSNIRFRLLLAVLYMFFVAIIDLSSKKILWFIVLTWWMSGKRRQSTREVIRFLFLLLYAIVFTSMVFHIFIEKELEVVVCSRLE